MPATLVAKLAPSPARADQRTRTTRQGSPNDDAPDFKQALAEARPKAADADSAKPADRPSPDAVSAKPKSTGESKKSAQHQKTARKSEQSPDSQLTDPAADQSVAAEATIDPVAADSVMELASQAVIDSDIEADTELPVLPVSEEQPAVVVPADADADPSASAASHPVAQAPDLAVPVAQPVVTSDSAVATDSNTTTATATTKADSPAAQATSVAAPAQPADATAAAKSVVPAAAPQAPAADTPSATPQSFQSTANASADPLVAADADRNPSSGDRNSDGDASARHSAGPAQARAAAAAEAGDAAQPAGEFSMKPGDAADATAADKIVATTADPTARSNTSAVAEKPAPAPSPQQAFAQQNHERIVSSVRTQLLPNGGSMQIRLQPGNLGNMQISVRMVDGVMSASFQTSSDEATRLLSHSLSQLKTTLETQGIQVDRIQVTQAPREAQSAQDNPSGDPNRQNSSRQEQQQQAHEENQRRLILNRMWQRMAIGEDPLDLVA